MVRIPFIDSLFVPKLSGTNRREEMRMFFSSQLGLSRKLLVEAVFSYWIYAYILFDLK